MSHWGCSNADTKNNGHISGVNAINKFKSSYCEIKLSDRLLQVM